VTEQFGPFERGEMNLTIGSLLLAQTLRVKVGDLLKGGGKLIRENSGPPPPDEAPGRGEGG
jgi:hypothetical protein